MKRLTASRNLALDRGLGSDPTLSVACAGDGRWALAYEAHIRKSDGTEVEVQVTKDFQVSAVNEMGGQPPRQGY
jgi:hypothetical protein